ncbi:MAG TPA: Xaa-Pro peptidase family protein [Gryllotalpicola sp.]
MTAAEISARLDRLRQKMSAVGLDAVMVGEKYNYWYLSGHQTREIEKVMRPMLFIVPLSGDPVAVLYRQQGATLQKTVPNAKLYGYEDVPFDTALLVEALADAGLSGARLGLELGPNHRLGLPYSQLQAVREALPGITIADAGPLLDDLRLHKSPYEIAALKAAADMSLGAWQRSVERFRVGMTEEEFARLVASELSAAGSQFDVAGHVSTYTTAGARTAPIQLGDTIWCDFGGTLDGYQADIARRAVIGLPRAEQLAEHERVSTLFRAALEAITPGARASDVARACNAAMQKAGLTPITGRKRIGHGLGLNAGESPSLGLEDDTLLEPGVVVCVEPRYFLPSGEKVHIEDVVVVTEQGFDYISRGCEQLVVIGA